MTFPPLEGGRQMPGSSMTFPPPEGGRQMPGSSMTFPPPEGGRQMNESLLICFQMNESLFLLPHRRHKAPRCETVASPTGMHPGANMLTPTPRV